MSHTRAPGSLHFCPDTAPGDLTASPSRFEAKGGSDYTSVFLVDEHPAIRTVLSRKINETEGVQVVGEAPGAKEALPHIERTAPDVAVVEISLVQVDGLTLTERIRTQVPETQVLIFSRYDDATYARWAIRAGASGYLVKTEPLDEVLRAIRKVEQGHIYLRQDILSGILGRVLRPSEESDDTGLSALTMREITVFQMLGDGNSMGQIAENLDLSRKTVETYRRQVKEKLGCDTTDELLKYAVLWTSEQVGDAS